MKLRFLPLGGFLLALIVLAWLSLGQPGFGLAAEPPTPPSAAECAALSLPDPATIVIPSGAQLADTTALAQAILSGADAPPEPVPADGGFAAPDPTTAGEAVCAARRLAALEDLIRARITLSLISPAIVAADGNPTIRYFLPPEGLTLGDSTWVEGIAASNTTVTMRILRNGSEIARDTVTSSGDGAYMFYLVPDCCGATSLWVLTAGDVIEISAGGKTAQTVAVPLSAWLDPRADRLEGRTLPGNPLTVTAYVSQLMSESCEPLSLERSTPVQPDGSFIISWEGVVDIKNNASFATCAIDASGNGPCFSAPAYHLAAWLPAPDAWIVSCQTKPATAFKLEVWRNGSVWSSFSGHASNTGYCGYYFYGLKPGDVIRLAGAPWPLEYAIQPLAATLEHATDQAVGQTTPGGRVRAQFYERGYNYSDGAYVTMSSCGEAYACRAGVADGSGAFSLDATFDITRGDYAYLTLYDAEGNWQQSPIINAPALFTNPVMGWVSGYWRTATSSALMVKVLDGANKVKASGSAQINPYDGGFFRYFGEGAIQAGDKIEVRDMNGQGVETMTTQSWNLRLDGATRRLTGSSENGYIVAGWKPECATGYYLSDPPDTCKQNNVAGPFELTFPAPDILPERVTLRGLDGHYTSHWVSRFSVSFKVNAFDFNVGTETPGATVSSTLVRDGVTIPIVCRRARPEWHWCAATDSAALINPPRPGDVVEVKTTDGDATSFVVPVLTVAGNGQPPAIFGVGPAEAPVCTSVEDYARFRTSWGYIISYMEPVAVATQSNAAGDYYASYAGITTVATASASLSQPVKPDSPCAALSASFGAGNEVSFAAYRYRPDPYPYALAVDEFENDDTQQTARPYSGFQHHTFDVENDADWVRFSVPERAVSEGRTYSIETFKLAYGAIHDMALHDAAESEPLLEWRVESLDGQPSSMKWQPAKAGTYYLRIQRPSSLKELFCGDVYDLRIRVDWPPVYLPVIMQ